MGLVIKISRMIVYQWSHNRRHIKKIDMIIGKKLSFILDHLQ